MALDVARDTVLSRHAMRAELLDAETELPAGHRLARPPRRGGAAPPGDRLHAAGDLDGGEVPPLWRADERPDSGGQPWADEGRRQVRPRTRGPVFDLCGLVDQGVDPGLCDAQLVDGPHRVDVSSQKALFFNLRRVQARLEREAEAQGERAGRASAARSWSPAEIGVPLADVEMMEGRLSGSDFSLNATQTAGEDGREWIEALEDDAPQAAERVAERARPRARCATGWPARLARSDRASGSSWPSASCATNRARWKAWARNWACRRSGSASWRPRAFGKMRKWLDSHTREVAALLD